MGLQLDKSFGLRLKKKRLDKKLTASALAELLGASANYISQLENGFKQPSMTFLLNIANALECSIDELYCDTLNVMQPYVLNEITQEMQGLSPQQVYEIHTVVRAMLSYMKDT